MMMNRALTLEQRAFIAGEQGICPTCEQEVDWKDLDPTFYVCEDCMAAIVNHEEDQGAADHHMIGYMDGLSDMLKSVLTDMVEKGDPAITVIRNVIRQVEVEKDVKL